MDVPHWQICKGESFHSVAVSITEPCYLSKLDITFGRNLNAEWLLHHYQLYIYLSYIYGTQ